MLLAAVLALNPVGLDFVRAAFLAGEQLSGNIAQPIVLAALAIMALAVIVEWLERFRAKWVPVRVKKTRQNKKTRASVPIQSEQRL
jgi:hypothetical protein